MDTDKVNRWLTLGANFGVLAGIILLVVELEQNREMMRAQTRNEIAAEIVDLLSQVATSNELSSLLSRAASGESLSDEDQRQFGHRALAMFRYFENVHYQYRQGMYDEEEYQAQRDAWRHNGGFLSRPEYKSVWCAWRETFSVEFRTEYESLFDNLAC
jgi:hypothetical protein